MALTGRQLSNGELILLEKLNQRPVELGDMPRPAAERLIAMGLVRNVLGTCEITHAGQLTCQRNRYRKAFSAKWLTLPRRPSMTLPPYRQKKSHRLDSLLPRRWFARLPGPTGATK